MSGLAGGKLRFPFRGQKLSRGALILLMMLIGLSLLTPLHPFGDPTAIGAGPRLSSPSLDEPLGTDALGRPMLARVLEGINATFLLSSAAVAIAAVGGVFLGMTAVYVHRLVDEVVVRCADLFFAFPPILLALLVSAIIGAGSTSAIAAIGIITLPAMIRVVRAATLVVVERDFVVAAEVFGASRRRVLFVHLLPNVAGAVVVQTAYAISLGMLVESAMSFLGLGVQPPSASLGSLLREGNIYLALAPWLVLAPAGFLCLAVVSVNLVGDGLRHTLDPIDAGLRP